MMCRFVCERGCGLLLLCCDSKRLAKFGSIATAPPSMEGPRHESQDDDGTVVSALVGLPDNVLGTNAQSAATNLPTPGCEQPGVSTSPTSVAAGFSPSQYHPACASGTSTRGDIGADECEPPRCRSPPYGFISPSASVRSYREVATSR